MCDHVAGADSTRRLPFDEFHRPLDEMCGGRDGRRAFAFDDFGILQLDDLPSRTRVGHQSVKRHRGDFALADLAGGQARQRRTREVAEDGVVVHAEDLHVLGDGQPRPVTGLKHLCAALVIGGHHRDGLRQGRRRVPDECEVFKRACRVRRVNQDGFAAVRGKRVPIPIESLPRPGGRRRGQDEGERAVLPE